MIAVLLGAVLVAIGAVVWFMSAPGGFRGPRCAKGVVDCREISGRVLYVEEQDPDRDGDVHLVLFSRDSLTRRFISVLKLPRYQRPADLPAFGRWVGASGTVYDGEAGERNLEVRQLVVAR